MGDQTALLQERHAAAVREGRFLDLTEETEAPADMEAQLAAIDAEDAAEVRDKAAATRLAKWAKEEERYRCQLVTTPLG